MSTIVSIQGTPNRSEDDALERYQSERRGPEKNALHLESPNSLEKSTIIAGPIKIDDRSKSVFVDGHEYHLSPKEYELLKLLAEDPGRVISHEEIVGRLWPEANRAVHSDIKQYILLLRKKIEKTPHQPHLIMNVKGFGYRLET